MRGKQRIKDEEIVHQIDITGGQTMNQLINHFNIPRTTLCAYIKRLLESEKITMMQLPRTRMRGSPAYIYKIMEAKLE